MATRITTNSSSNSTSKCCYSTTTPSPPSLAPPEQDVIQVTQNLRAFQRELSKSNATEPHPQRRLHVRAHHGPLAAPALPAPPASVRSPGIRPGPPLHQARARPVAHAQPTATASHHRAVGQAHRMKRAALGGPHETAAGCSQCRQQASNRTCRGPDHQCESLVTKSSKEQNARGEAVEFYLVLGLPRRQPTFLDEAIRKPELQGQGDAWHEPGRSQASSWGDRIRIASEC